MSLAGVLVGLIVESAPLVWLAAIDPSIVSAVIAGCFMLVNSGLIWYLARRESR